MSPRHPVLAPIHDFAAKLRQEGLVERVREYVAWRRAVAAARAAGRPAPPPPERAPVSLNLDLTTACNFACAHCVDWDILNSGVSFEHGKLERSLARLAERGLRSVILIGGGEPTVHPRFRETVRLLKELGLQVAIVSNGARNERILDVVDVLEEEDWIRLSLDAGTDATFQAMHRPKKPVTLEEICAWIPKIRERNPVPRMGFSFVVTWAGAERTGGEPVVENVHEIVPAARRARDARFDYVSYKPFLVRTPEGAEIIDPEAARRRHAEVVARIRTGIDEARRTYASDAFAVLESTNLKLLESGAWRDWTEQPRTCHMQAFRQVLTPQGLWNCPAHRGVAHGRVAAPDAWAEGDAVRETADLLDGFDASHACREVTCLYHGVNWWLESLVRSPDELPEIAAVPGEDFFL
jgi:hypothetical protein